MKAGRREGTVSRREYSLRSEIGAEKRSGDDKRGVSRLPFSTWINLSDLHLLSTFGKLRIQ